LHSPFGMSLHAAVLELTVPAEPRKPTEIDLKGAWSPAPFGRQPAANDDLLPEVDTSGAPIHSTDAGVMWAPSEKRGA